ncbi:hypothetical protein [Nannocystis punicea]|uniref:Uncharacterized protein n=1 Tax=Nannocystis punicea TaxID=2995304 RepID=A0ABY7GST3_9BACT|nr:hypothetical protein [Nannocystis poenicansa]WAS89978.1 hypothetical protein O0S08_27610 [Nannocystis poenicansa]
MLSTLLLPPPEAPPVTDLPALLDRAYRAQVAAQEREREAEGLASTDPRRAAGLHAAIRLWVSSAEDLDRAGRAATPETAGWRSKRANRAIEATQVMFEAERVRTLIFDAPQSCPSHLSKARQEFIAPALAAVGDDDASTDLRVMLGNLERRIAGRCPAEPTPPEPKVADDVFRASRARLAVLGTSATAALALGIVAVAEYGWIRTDGPLHRQIQAAAQQTAGYDPNSPDLCKGDWARGTAVEPLCERHQTGRTAMLTTAALSGVFLLTTAVVAVVHGCARRGACESRRSQLRVAGEFAPGGALLQIGGRF